MKTLFYKLFGFGKIHEPLFGELKNERLIASDEGVKSTITYLNFRAPGKYANWKRQWFSGAIALTEKRLVLMRLSVPEVDVSLTDERFSKLKVSTEADDTLLIAYNSSLFLENSSGQIERRFRTPQAQILAETIRQKMK